MLYKESGKGSLVLIVQVVPLEAAPEEADSGLRGIIVDALKLIDCSVGILRQVYGPVKTVLDSINHNQALNHMGRINGRPPLIMQAYAGTVLTM